MTSFADIPLAHLFDRGPVRSLRPLVRDASLLAVAIAKASCPTCRYALPFLERLYRRLPEGRSPAVVLVSQDGDEDAASLASELALSFPVLLEGAEHPLSRALGLRVVPHLVLFADAGGGDADPQAVLSCEAFQRDLYERVARELQARAGLDARPLFAPDEKVPVLRPG